MSNSLIAVEDRKGGDEKQPNAKGDDMKRLPIYGTLHRLAYENPMHATKTEAEMKQMMESVKEQLSEISKLGEQKLSGELSRERS